MLKGPLDTYMNYTCCIGIKYELGFFKHSFIRSTEFCILLLRFFENYIGRSKEFVTYFYPFIKEEFKDELKDFTLDDIIIVGYPMQELKEKNKQLKFPIGI